MSNREASNRILKALAIATFLHSKGVKFADAHRVKLDQGPFWTDAAKATGRDGLSEATRFQACYYLAALEFKARKARKLVRVK